MFEDLLKVQKEIQKINKGGSNPHFKSNYITLSALLEEVKPVLNTNNFVLTQYPVMNDGVTCLKTELIHKTGNKLECLIPLISKDPTDPQKLGSSVTYMRRYSLLSLLAIEDTDDDGNNTSKAKEPTGEPNNSGSSSDRLIDEAEKKMLKEKIGLPEFSKLMATNKNKIPVSIFAEKMKEVA